MRHKEYYKTLILNALKLSKRLPTYRVAATVGINVHKAREILTELEKEGVILAERETLATYWSYKNQRGLHD